MGLLSNFLTPQRPAPDDDVTHIRNRARRRLIGAAVLLAVGVIGFPLLFETQPRPGPADIPVVIARKDGAVDAASSAKVADKSTTGTSADGSKSGAASRAAGAALPMLIESPSDAEGDAATVAAAAAATTVAAATSVKPVVVPKPTPSTVGENRPTSKPSTALPPATSVAAKPLVTKPVKPPVSAVKPAVTVAAVKPPAVVSAKPPATPPAAVANGARFVVQVGAFAQDAGVRDVRGKLERVGLKSYTQSIKINGSQRTRVRAGPYNSREEAERAAEKAKSVGLSPSVVPLE